MDSDLLSLEGIGRKKAQALRDAGFISLDDVRRASIEELRSAEGIGGTLAKDIKRQAEAMKTPLAPEVGEEETPLFAASPADDEERNDAQAERAIRKPDAPLEQDPTSSSRRRGLHLTPLIAVFMVAVFVGGAVLGGFVGYWMLSGDIDELRQENDVLENRISTINTTSPTYTYFFGNTSLSLLYEKVRSSVVSIGAYKLTGLGNVYYKDVVGSGFVYNHTGRMVVVTNYHVVEGTANITVTFHNGHSYAATVLGSDPYADLAVVSVDAPHAEFHPLPVISSATLEVGDPVVAVGNPFGLRASMTRGIVSQLGRTIRESSAGNFPIPNIIQISAPINPGNSGGPLLNYRGEVVGITTAIIEDSENIGFAIPSRTVLRELGSLITNGTYTGHAYLGVTGYDMNYQLAQIMDVNTTYGWLLADVKSGTPADRAGLQGSDRQASVGGTLYKVGGDIIVAINNKSVLNGDDLMSYLEAETEPGQRIKVTVVRDGKEQTVNVTLGSRPPPP